MGFVRLIGLVAAAALLVAAETPKAERLAKEAEKAEKAGETVRAYLLYAQAAVEDRRNPAYWAKAEALRPRAEAQSKGGLSFPELKISDGTNSTDILPPTARSIDEVRTFTAQDLQDLERMAPPPRLKPSTLIKTFHLKGDAKTLFEQVSKEFGYTVIFDKDYNPSGNIRFDLAEAGYRDALHALEEATNSFIVPIAERAMLVAVDTAQKRTELENDEAQAIPIPQRTSVQEAQELLTMVQQAFEIRHAVLDPQKRMILLRDRVSRVETAIAILNQLSIGKPQISLEVEFLSTASTSSLSLGMKLPTQFPIVNFGDLLQTNPFTPAGFTRLLKFGGGKTFFFGIGITDAQLFATASRSSASSVLRSTIVASDGQPASLHLGDKYPIVTGGYFGVGNSAGSGGVGTPGSTTFAVLSTSSYTDSFSSAVSTTGSMKLVVNGQDLKFTLTPAINNLTGLQQVIGSLAAGVVPAVVQRGTKNKPISLVLAASTLGVTSIQLVDDPTGANINLMRAPDVPSSISLDYPDATQTNVSKTGNLSLVVGTRTFPITLASDKNNLNGLRDAINGATVPRHHPGETPASPGVSPLLTQFGSTDRNTNSETGVTASVLVSNLSSGTVYLQVVAKDNTITKIQLYDDPSGANTPLLDSTDEINLAGTQFGQTVSGTGSSFNSNLGQVYTPPPTFTFEDLGLILKVTPTVHSAEEVSLDIEAEFKTLGAGSYNGVPVINTRKYQGKVRLRTSEWAVVAGLFSDTQSRGITGIPGLMNVPALGFALRDNEKSSDTNEILIVLKPHITSLPASEYVNRTLWVGSETRPFSPI